MAYVPSLDLTVRMANHRATIGAKSGTVYDCPSVDDTPFVRAGYGLAGLAIRIYRD